MLRIAIQHDKQALMSGRQQSFSTRWHERLASAGHEARRVDAFKPGFFASLEGCDGFMWWFAHLPYPRNFGKRLLQAVEHGTGLPVFPNTRTIWHFDDKLAQQYLLEAARIPVPETRIFWTAKAAHAFCQTATYPLVLKLASGITSENVVLVRNAAEAQYWVSRLFERGAVTLKRRGLAVHPRTMAQRVTDAASHLLSGAMPALGRRTDLQKGYFLVQEFLAGNAFDTRVTVIGNRAFAFRRFNRPDDFRASGSGLIDWNPADVALDAVRLAFHVARVLGTQSLAVDVLRRDGQALLNEISYYYEGWAVHECPGHWTIAPGAGADDPVVPLRWVDGKMAPEDAILEDFLAEVAMARSRAQEPP
jgi:glutathione synthase/RimK-type ligase-like ATP-grasp enzyme